MLDGASRTLIVDAEPLASDERNVVPVRSLPPRSCRDPSSVPRSCPVPLACCAEAVTTVDDLTLEQLTHRLVELGEPAFRAWQVWT